jgi:hypothetical protein
VAKQESELKLERQARESGTLLERLQDSRRRIGKMCSERRGPRMTIPVNWADDDFFICLAIEDAITVLQGEDLSGLIQRLRDMAHGMNSPMNQATLRVAAEHLEKRTTLETAVGCTKDRGSVT